MNKIAQWPASRRTEVFEETAARKNLPAAVVEKDFWVCWMLQQIFSLQSFRDRLLFKGGTSLSKVFHAIGRFSEDIDLAVDYAALGFVGEKDPRQPGISRSKRERILSAMLEECQRFIASEFLTELSRQCEGVLGSPGPWELRVREDDPHIVLFRYPEGSRQPVSYVQPVVILEMGTHAEFVPRGTFPIQPFIVEEFPTLGTGCDVTALLAKRTFWEKITILHAEHHRPLDRPTPRRYSRHYYDVAVLSRSAVKDDALSDLELLPRVVRHKQEFYPATWASYETATLSGLKLYPREERIDALKKDYGEMGVMIFGTPPSFEEIVSGIKELERELNAIRPGL